MKTNLNDNAPLQNDNKERKLVNWSLNGVQTIDKANYY